MQWEQLTAPDFAKAVKDTGLCVLPVGCLEQHFDHLPLGTDGLNAHRICVLAARREPAVVFPPYWFGQIHEARCYPGTIAIDPILTVQLLLNTCDEIARNGFGKILLYNGHGGNTQLVNYVCQAMLARRREYVLYLTDWQMDEEHRRRERGILETRYGGHACERETSLTMAVVPELVKMDALGDREAPALGRLGHLSTKRVTAGFYADHPDHYAGDARPASAEKGKQFLELQVDHLASLIAAVKADKAAPTIANEFYDRCENLTRS